MSRGATRLWLILRESLSWICLSLLLFVVFVPSESEAAEVQMQLSTQAAGVGDKIRVQAVVEPADGEPRVGSPKLQVSGGARVQGPSFGPRQEMRLDMNGLVTKTSYIATWIVSPTQEGKLVIGPATFDQGGKTISGKQIVLDISAQRQAAPRRRRSPFDFDFSFDFPQRERRMPQLDPAPPELRAEKALDPYAFLEAHLDAREVVVGQPLRVTVVAYGSQGDFGEAVLEDLTFPDFASYLVLASSEEEPPYAQKLGDTEYVVRKIREYILVPLRAGRLRIGPLSAVIQGRRQRLYPARGHAQGVAVHTQALEIEVTEPPEASRPPGYVPGDVGKYRLKSQVSPRQVEQDEYLEVLISISGEGQIPAGVLLPEGKDVEWQPPTIKGGPEISEGKLQGTRTLKYAAQMKGIGKVSLGAVELPFYDHEAKRYRIARADLGEVTVSPASHQASKSATSPTDQDAQTTSTPSPAVQSIPLEPRSSLQPVAPSRRLALPSWTFWSLLLAPLGVAFAVRIPGWLHRLGAAHQSKDKDQSKVFLKEANQVFRHDWQKAIPLFERAIFEVIHASTALRARGVLKSELGRELEKLGVAADLASEAQEVLSDLEAARYGSSSGATDSLKERVNQLVARLAKVRAKAKKET